MDDKISIIVPMYNSELTITETLNSIFKQKSNEDFGNFEVIIIDDGSTDDSLQAAQDFQRKYTKANIVMLDGEGKGVSHARNLGLTHATGTWITFMDSDDFFGQSDFSSVLDLLNSSEFTDVNIVTYPEYYFNEYSERQFSEYGFPTNVRSMTVSRHPTTDKVRYRFTWKSPKVFPNIQGNVYSENEYYWIAQARLNVLIRNLEDNKIYFEEDLLYAEDSIFVAQYVSSGNGLGRISKGITYHYLKNKYSTVDKYSSSVTSYKMILKWADRVVEKLTVGDYVSPAGAGILLNEFGARLKMSRLFPMHLNEAEYTSWNNSMKRILRSISPEIFTTGMGANKNAGQFIINKFVEMRGDIELHPKGNSIQVIQDGEVILEDKHFEVILTGLELQDGALRVSAVMKFYFTDKYRPEVSVKIDGDKGRLIDTYVSSYSYLGQKHKLYTFYAFDTKIPLDEISSSVEFEFHMFGHTFRTNLVDVKNSRLVPLSSGNDTVHLPDGRYLRMNLNNFSFTLTKADISDYVSYQQAVAFELYGNLPIFSDLREQQNSTEEVWLYSDFVGKIDNAFFQFLNDKDKNDNIKRYYIVHDGFEDYIPGYAEFEDRLVPYGSLTHRKLFLTATYVITSFQDANEFSPYSAYQLKKASGFFNPNVVYLQHGVLHAKMARLNSREKQDFYKLIVASSKFERDYLLNEYHFDSDMVLLSGMPRFDSRLNIANYQSHDLKNRKGMKVLFAPSWRASLMLGRSTKTGWMPNEEKMIRSEIFKTLQTLVGNDNLENEFINRDIELDIKLHPIMYNVLGNKLEQNSRVKFVSGSVNLNDYDLFVTDFSSYVYDAVERHVPVAFFIPDNDEYVNGSHTYTDVNMPDGGFGPTFYSLEDFVAFIKDFSMDRSMLDSYQKVVDDFFDLDAFPMDSIYNKMMQLNVRNEIKRNAYFGSLNVESAALKLVDSYNAILDEAKKEKYLGAVEANGNVVALSKIHSHGSTQFRKALQMPIEIGEDDEFISYGLYPTPGGTPRLVTNVGFVTANKKFVRPISYQIATPLKSVRKFVKRLTRR